MNPRAEACMWPVEEKDLLPDSNELRINSVKISLPRNVMEDDWKEINGKLRGEIKLSLQVNCIICHHDLLELIMWAFQYGESNESNCSWKLACLHCLENRPIITQGMSIIAVKAVMYFSKWCTMVHNVLY